MNAETPAMRGLCAAMIALAVGTAGATGAQTGFAGMGTDPEAGFALPTPDYRLTFPRDHGPHPDFRLEWWYLTANLQGPDGTDYGAQWTLFRIALAPEAEPLAGWESPQIWMGHAGLTTPDAHFAAERFARGGIGQAGVTPAPFSAWIDDWAMTGLAEPPQDGLDHLSISASGPGFSYRLEARAEGPLVAHGAGGFSLKSDAGTASHYYSQPFYTVTGWIAPEGTESPIEVTGQAWLDREWSSQFLEGRQAGWDWFALHLYDGRRLMLAQVRNEDTAPFRFGTLIGADGTARPLGGDEIEMTPIARAEVAGRAVPVHWRLAVPGAGIDVTAQAVNPRAWMPLSVPYWEGPVRFGGSHSGRGYLEMTAP